MAANLKLRVREYSGGLVISKKTLRRSDLAKRRKGILNRLVAVI